MIDTKGLYPVAIGCTGGSGSRVLREILGASPQIFMDQDCSANSKDSQKSKTFLHQVELPPETIMRLIEEFLLTILIQIPPGVESRYKYFGWKNPPNIRHVDMLLQVHPELRFLHLIRDPAAVARGGQQKKVYKREKANGHLDPAMDRDEFTLTRWVNQNLPVWKKYKDHPRYLLVRYEDMINKPEKTVQWIFDWLGVDEFSMSEALAAVTPPEDAISRGNDVDITIISEAAKKLGYGYRV
jgi:hypothetical protein